MRAKGGRRDEIVRAAFHRVARTGFEGLRLRDVAEDVGVDHSTLHHHVRTKQDIAVGVAEYATYQFWGTLPLDVPPGEALRGYLDNLTRLLDEWPELFAVTVELDLRARRDPAIAATMREYESGWRQVLVELISTGNDAGSWARRMDPAATAELLIAATKGTRLAPECTPAVYRQLTALLFGRHAEPE